MKWILASLFLVSSFAVAQPAFAKTLSRKTAADQSAISDTVKKVREDDDGIVILFEKTAGSYYLRRDVPDFDAYKKKLQDSLSSKKPVSVTVDATQLNILEVK